MFNSQIQSEESVQTTWLNLVRFIYQDVLRLFYLCTPQWHLLLAQQAFREFSFCHLFISLQPDLHSHLWEFCHFPFWKFNIPEVLCIQWEEFNSHWRDKTVKNHSTKTTLLCIRCHSSLKILCSPSPCAVNFFTFVYFSPSVSNFSVKRSLTATPV